MSTVVPAKSAYAVAEETVYRKRWLVLSLFIFSDTLNFLDRQLLAAVAPAIKSEFLLSNAQYGWILSAFAVIYMVFAPLAGLMVDRIGIRRSMAISVSVWSLSAVANGLVQSLRGLVATRMVLGIAETASIPSGSKAVAGYLKPSELGFGIAANAFGFTLGAILAPLVGAFFLARSGWRPAFLVCGLVGLLWVPLWWIFSRALPPRDVLTEKKTDLKRVLSDRRLWSLAIANIFIMTLHTLWFNWTTIYFVEVQHLTAVEANQRFAWIPAVFATVGGFFGGWLGYRLIQKGMDALAARARICAIAAPLLLVTAVIPFVTSPLMAAGVIGCSFFICMMMLTNLHVIPIHWFGYNHAAFTASVLALSYSLLQVFFSPVVGFVVDKFGFSVVCVAVAPLPLLGYAILRSSFEKTP